ncbi:MAG: hypothetical protein AAF378_08320 [Cyanobacteria bacterium P01_A01_bin.84]
MNYLIVGGFCLGLDAIALFVFLLIVSNRKRLKKRVIRKIKGW